METILINVDALNRKDAELIAYSDLILHLINEKCLNLNNLMDYIDKLTKDTKDDEKNCLIFKTKIKVLDRILRQAKEINI